MRILFDKNVPYQLRSCLVAHSVQTAAQLGWSRLVNGDLLKAAEDHAFDIIVTGDQSLEYQQNLKGRKLSIIVLGSNRLSILEKNTDRLVAAVDAAAEGSYEFVKYELPPKPRRGPPE